MSVGLTPDVAGYYHSDSNQEAKMRRRDREKERLYYLKSKEQKIARAKEKRHRLKAERIKNELSQDGLLRTAGLAKLRGDMFYYTGKMCQRGHISKRFASSRKCVKCSEEDNTHSTVSGANKANTSRWKRANPHKAADQFSRRRAAQLTATLPTDDGGFFIDEIYHISALRTKVTGIRWEVDHIIPLRSKVVCGFHVWYNLQVVPKKYNLKKGNRLFQKTWLEEEIERSSNDHS